MGNGTSKDTSSLKGIFGKDLEYLNNICYQIINKQQPSEFLNKYLLHFL